MNKKIFQDFLQKARQYLLGTGASQTVSLKSKEALGLLH